MCSTHSASSMHYKHPFENLSSGLLADSLCPSSATLPSLQRALSLSEKALSVVDPNPVFHTKMKLEISEAVEASFLEDEEVNMSKKGHTEEQIISALKQYA